MLSDTIAAPATGSGVSAIGILRISGSGAVRAAGAVFRRKDGKPLEAAENRRLYFGALTDVTGSVIDLCLCTVSRGPNSYTGEDTAELQCHGSPAVLAAGLKALYAAGVRPAEPGEFTKRAFLNGKMDLTQAEAVADLIDAETAAMARSAAGKLESSVGARTDVLYDRLLDLIAHFYAVLDYPDEDLDDFRTEECRDTFAAGEAELERLLSTFDRGRILKEGVPAAILGRPNVGKSSLLNALLGYDRAIVTDIPGTTRDTIEEKVKLGDTVLRLTDTAGLRETGDRLEKLGVERSLKAAGQARLILAVLDGSREFSLEDGEVLDRAAAAEAAVAVVNKCDLPLKLNVNAVRGKVPDVCLVSAKDGTGIPELCQMLGERFALPGDVSPAELVTSERQADCMRRALTALRSASEALASGMTPDAVLVDAEEALSDLGEISGRTFREELVSRIFERFCVGK